MPAAPKMVIMKYQKEAHVNAIARRAVALSCHFILDERREIQKGRQTIVPIPINCPFPTGSTSSFACSEFLLNKNLHINY